MIKNIIKKLIRWIGLLLSDSRFASTKRFIGIQAFYNLIIFAILGFYYKEKLANLDLLMQLASYFFTISVATIIGTTITDVAGIIKAGQLQKDENTDYFNNYR